MPAVDVFAAVIQYFKMTLQTLLQNSTAENLDSHEETGENFGNNSRSKFEWTFDDVFWVITVPAIWDLRAKQFMRVAAEKVLYY